MICYNILICYKKWLANYAVFRLYFIYYIVACQTREEIIKPMKDFQNYLLNKHLATEKTAPYCVSWVTKGYASADKDLDSPLSTGEAFL